MGPDSSEWGFLLSASSRCSYCTAAHHSAAPVGSHPPRPCYLSESPALVCVRAYVLSLASQHPCEGAGRSGSIPPLPVSYYLKDLSPKKKLMYVYVRNESNGS